ncbi:hypothetical protein ACWGH7_16510 [Streptomyces cyaneofuscatus]
MSARDDLYLFAMTGKVQENGNRQMAVQKLDAYRDELLAGTKLSAELAEDDYRRIVRAASQMEQNLRARISELEAAQTTAVAERDAQIIAWLVKKAGEEGSSNRERRARAEAIYCLADKMSRGAVRPPLSKGPDSIEFGIRVTSNGPDSEVLRYPGESRSAIEARLARHRTGNPDAHLVQRTVHYGAWTDAATT